MKKKKKKGKLTFHSLKRSRKENLGKKEKCEKKLRGTMGKHEKKERQG